MLLTVCHCGLISHTGTLPHDFMHFANIDEFKFVVIIVFVVEFLKSTRLLLLHFGVKCLCKF